MGSLAPYLRGCFPLDPLISSFSKFPWYFRRLRFLLINLFNTFDHRLSSPTIVYYYTLCDDDSTITGTYPIHLIIWYNATWFSVITHMELLRILGFLFTKLFVFQEQQRRHLAVTIVPLHHTRPTELCLLTSLLMSLNH